MRRHVCRALLIPLNKFIQEKFPYPMFLSALGVVFSLLYGEFCDARDSEIAKKSKCLGYTM